MPVVNRTEAVWILAAKGFLTREALRRFQSRQLVSLVRYAGASVPYYRRLFKKHGFDPRAFRGIQDLGDIPISSKDDLISAIPEDLVSSRVKNRRLLARTTSGSTGRPFTVRCTRFEDRYLSALRFRVYMKMGMRIRDSVAGIRFVGGDSRREPWVGFLNRLGMFRVSRLNSSLSPREIAHRLDGIGADVVRGYANLTSLVADAVQEANLEVRPRMVIVGGDTLTPGMKQRIGDAFQAPVREVYGSHEFNMIAWECKATGSLHVCEEGVVLEVIREGRPAAAGKRGEVVATALHSFAQPFIRFRLGDVATQGGGPCRCGAPYKTIDSIEGRIYDRIILPDGRAASPGDVLSRLEQGFDWVKQYQMVQERSDLVVLRLVPKTAPPSGDVEAIDGMMEGFLGPGIRHRVDLLEAIPLAPGEKFRASISKVFSNY